MVGGEPLPAGRAEYAEMCAPVCCICKIMFAVSPCVYASRVVKKVPDLIEQFVERAASLIKTQDGAVQLAGVALMLQVSPAG